MAQNITDQYLIKKGGLWYRPNSQGYTQYKFDAGRYSLEEAKEIVRLAKGTKMYSEDDVSDYVSDYVEKAIKEMRNQELNYLLKIEVHPSHDVQDGGWSVSDPMCIHCMIGTKDSYADKLKEPCEGLEKPSSDQWDESIRGPKMSTSTGKVIFKYQMPVLEKFTMKLPKGAEIIRMADQGGMFWMWAVVDTREPDETRTFYAVKCGANVPEKYLIYRGFCAIHVQQELGLYIFEAPNETE